MIIEVPDDLSTCSYERLRELDRAINSARNSVRVELDSPERLMELTAGRPRWARNLYRLISGPNKKRAERYVMGFAVLVVLTVALPPFLNTLIRFTSLYQASHYQGIQKTEPKAPVLEVEQK